MTPTETLDTARHIVGIVPLVMRIVGAEFRRNPELRDEAQIGLMGMLSHKGMCTMSALAHRWSVSLPTMSRSVRRLEERNWVQVSRADQDRRQVLVELTPAGKAILDQSLDRAAHRIDEMVEALSAEDHRRLAEGLDVLRQMFERAAQSPGEDGKPPCRDFSNADVEGQSRAR